jgi:hypothetical protein
MLHASIDTVSPEIYIHMHNYGTHRNCFFIQRQNICLEVWQEIKRNLLYPDYSSGIKSLKRFAPAINNRKFQLLFYLLEDHRRWHLFVAKYLCISFIHISQEVRRVMEATTLWFGEAEPVMPCHQSSKDFAGHWRRPRLKRPTTNVYFTIVEVYIPQMLPINKALIFNLGLLLGTNNHTYITNIHLDHRCRSTHCSRTYFIMYNLVRIAKMHVQTFYVRAQSFPIKCHFLWTVWKRQFSML